jgi:D-alanine-D-alanine ligase
MTRSKATTKRKVTVLLGDPRLPDASKHEARFNAEDVANVARMTAAIESLGRYEVATFSDHATLMDRLRADPPEFVLNFCDTGLRNDAALEWHVACYMEMLRIPYSGAGPAAMAICYDKGVVRAVAAGMGVPVPAEEYFDDPAEAVVRRFPALIKPNHGDGSVGITKDAVVRNEAEARRYLDFFADTLPGRAALVQQYLPGPEYGVGVIGNPETGLRVLPVLEVDFGALPQGLAPILSFESKAMPGSPYWTDIKFHRARLDDRTAARLGKIACALFKRLGLRDYGRFDYRTAADGEIKLMEVNPNPAWAWDGKLAMMAGFAGLSYAEMLGLVIEAAQARLGLAPVSHQIARDRLIPVAAE